MDKSRSSCLRSGGTVRRSPGDLSGFWERPLARRQFITAAGAGASLLLLPLGRASAATGSHDLAASGADAESIVVAGNQAFLQGVRDSKLGPPMVARALAIGHTCIYEAWAAYDRRAIGTLLGGTLRQSPSERTLANKMQAISTAAYPAAADLFPLSRFSMFDPLMEALGYDPGDLSTDTSTATGIGNLAANAVLDFRHKDGANQLGDEPGGIAGMPYSDYTGYAPVNGPIDVRVPFDRTLVHDPNAWQPLRYVDSSGRLVTQGFLGAQWQRVTPFALSSPSQLRSSTGPATYGSSEYRGQGEVILELSRNLTDEQKMIAEYWADGPNSELPPGHWNLFAQFVSRRDKHGPNERGIDSDVKLFFALTNAIFDAGICAWDNKCQFNSVRPITAVRYLFRRQKVLAWAGPYQGTQRIDAATWLPYQPITFPTPPFPEYSSGHSNFSAAGAEIVTLFTGSDHFGDSVTFPAGSSRVEPGAVPATDLTLSWATFSEAADQAGISRRYGGIHFEQGDLDGRSTGRTAARIAWSKAQQSWQGGNK
jgi:hypothetical protein